MTITASSHVQARWILTELNDEAIWSRIKFKPKKSRHVVIRHRKMTSSLQLQVQGEAIPSVEERTLATQRARVQASLQDQDASGLTPQWCRLQVC